MVGSLLYGQRKQTWLEFQHDGLSRIKQGENTIMPILKLSYHNLPPWLKSCFSFCAVFPKDSVIEKERLISLWMAHGYIEPLLGVQTIVETYEEYFMILLRRCFFQDVENDEFGKIMSCKMHDMAKEIAGNEICIADSTTSSLDKNNRHVYDTFGYHTESCFTNTKIRTCLHQQAYPCGLKFPSINMIVTKWMCLRVLELHHVEEDCRIVLATFCI